jgi:hypothetical protein
MAAARRGEGGPEWLVLLARVSPCFACGSNMFDDDLLPARPLSTSNEHFVSGYY